MEENRDNNEKRVSNIDKIKELVKKKVRDARVKQEYAAYVRAIFARYQSFAVLLWRWLRKNGTNFDLVSDTDVLSVMCTNIYAGHVPQELKFKFRMHLLAQNFDKKRLEAVLREDFNAKFPYGEFEFEVTRDNHNVYIKVKSAPQISADKMYFNSATKAIEVYDCGNNFLFSVTAGEDFHILCKGSWRKVSFALRMDFTYNNLYIDVPGLGYSRLVNNSMMLLMDSDFFMR